MVEELREILQKLLTAVDFGENKDSFISTFLDNVQLQVAVDLLSSLPMEKQLSLKDEFAQATTPEKFGQLLKKHFSEEQIQQAFGLAFRNHLTEWYTIIQPQLSPEQHQKLQQVLDTF
jgi:hypothetical protein